MIRFGRGNILQKYSTSLSGKSIEVLCHVISYSSDYQNILDTFQQQSTGKKTLQEMYIILELHYAPFHNIFRSIAYYYSS